MVTKGVVLIPSDPSIAIPNMCMLKSWAGTDLTSRAYPHHPDPVAVYQENFYLVLQATASTSNEPAFSNNGMKTQQSSYTESCCSERCISSMQCASPFRLGIIRFRGITFIFRKFNIQINSECLYTTQLLLFKANNEDYSNINIILYRLDALL